MGILILLFLGGPFVLAVVGVIAVVIGVGYLSVKERMRGWLTLGIGLAIASIGLTMCSQFKIGGCINC